MLARDGFSAAPLLSFPLATYLSHLPPAMAQEAQAGGLRNSKPSPGQPRKDAEAAVGSGRQSRKRKAVAAQPHTPRSAPLSPPFDGYPPATVVFSGLDSAAACTATPAEDAGAALAGRLSWQGDAELAAAELEDWALLAPEEPAPVARKASMTPRPSIC
jgi:hypothetical protein